MLALKDGYRGLGMFYFKLEDKISLLTVTRKGPWSLRTVADYEIALRRELLKLKRLGSQTSFIIDIRSSAPQSTEVAEALRAMVQRLGPLHADRTAIVTSSGLAKLQAIHVADDNAAVFTSLVLARDWALQRGQMRLGGIEIYDVPSIAEAKGRAVHVHGPSDLDINLTPKAAIETARRIGKAANDALL